MEELENNASGNNMISPDVRHSTQANPLMKLAIPVFAAALLLPAALSSAATLTLTAPLDYQVIQRKTKFSGTIAIGGGCRTKKSA